MASLLSQQQQQQQQPSSTTTNHPRPLGSSPATAYPFRPTPSSTKKMSISQTYFLAHRARAKLAYEAARPDHNLRLLVGHANLLDSLMLELAEAEREQEYWFNQTVRGASSSSSHSSSEERHVQWADTIVEEPEHDWHAEDAESDSDSSDCSSDSDSDFDADEEDQDIEMADAVPLRRIPSNSATLYNAAYQTFTQKQEEDYDMEEDYDEDEDEDITRLALQRTPSHSHRRHHLHSASTSPSSPPGLEADDSDDSGDDDAAMPPSPPTALLPTFAADPKTQQGVPHPAGDEDTTTIRPTHPGDKAAFYEEGYYLPPRNPARLISAISVY
ncbi:hypothetical protein VTJ04DRAFT_310 [Mycothermus thermophilus]|uniref:uncharacterized protein n=1 Tax=Humicola insolens TaxID=85995 RepID=UPI0037422F65